jgi:hypothetical protein
VLNLSRVDGLRAGLTGTHATQWARLYRQADSYRGQTPPTEHPTASITYFGPAAANLALAYRLSGQTGYAREAWRWLETAIAYPHWGKAHLPDHDLDAGWLLHGLSLAYHWLGDALEPAERAALRDKLALQGERLHDFAVETEGTWWSSSYWQNHNWICYTGLATAGYVLDRPEWTKRARENFETVIDLMPADGSNHEGVVYWRYGVPWLAIYLDLLRDAEGIDWWDRCRFLANTFWYRLHQTAPGFAENVDHGDCHDRHSGHSIALYHKLAAEYRIGEARWLADHVADRLLWEEAHASGVRPGVLPEAYLELLWFDPSVPSVPPAERTPTTAYFPDLGLLAARTGWDADATLLSFKASPGGGHTAWREAERLRTERGWTTLNAGHHHPDAGAFVLASHGAFLAVEDGYSNRKRAAHHNLLLVDGHGFAGEDRYHVYADAPFDRQARLRDVLAEGGWAHATAELAAMYEPALGVRRLDRTAVLTPSGQLVLLDRMAADEPREWTFLLHADWPLETHGDDYALRSGPAQAWVRRHVPHLADVEQTVTEVEANPTASTPSLRITRRLHTLRVTTARRNQAMLMTTIEPTHALAPSPPRATRAVCTAGYGITFGDRETVLLAPTRRRVRHGLLTADAAAVLIDHSGGVDRVAVVRATRVEVDGRVLLDATTPVTGVLTGEVGG